MTDKLTCDFFSLQSLAQEQFQEQLARSLPEPSREAYQGLDNINYEREMQHAIDSFLRVDCVKSDELKRFTKCILRMEVSKRLGLLLFEVCLLEFNLIVASNKLDKLENIRESIYDALQELCIVYGKDKDKYLLITPLLYCAILKKLFTVSKKLINADQKYRLFHVVFFELKGQLVSDQFLEALVDKHFNDNFNKFIKEYSQNMTPIKLKKQDKSLTKSEYKSNLVQPRFTKTNKENSLMNQNINNYHTNRHLISKANRQGDHNTVSPRNIEPKRRL